MKNLRQHLQVLFLQLTVWVGLGILPLVIGFFYNGFNGHAAYNMFRLGVDILLPISSIYFINYFLLVPLLAFKKHWGWYLLVNAVLMLIANFQQVFLDTSILPSETRSYYYTYVSLLFVISILAILTAFGMRNWQRSIEERQKSTEAELMWLKNQINPHFLFNTLNNISSLTQIDADQAQDAIAQLSDLLRYTIYETNLPMVPLSGELQFLTNYIELMKLRCNEHTTIDYYFSVVDSQLTIPPLLFISLVENAFKHGLSSNRDSLISIRLTQEGHTLTFTCDNTNYPKTRADCSGSGIGLENSRRRLDLLYKGRYQWEQLLTDEGIFHVCITLEL